MMPKPAARCPPARQLFARSGRGAISYKAHHREPISQGSLLEHNLAITAQDADETPKADALLGLRSNCILRGCGRTRNIDEEATCPFTKEVPSASIMKRQAPASLCWLYP